MKLKGEPYRIDFIGNNPDYMLRTTPNETDGRQYRVFFQMTGIYAGELELNTPYRIFKWTVVDTETKESELDEWKMAAANTPSKVEEQLVKKLKYNHYLNLYYNINIELVSNPGQNTIVRLTLIDLQPGETDLVTLKNNGNAYYKNDFPGIDITPRNDYKAVCRFEVDRNGETMLTPNLYYDDNNGTVVVKTDILKAFFNKPDIPYYRESISAVPLDNSFIRARMLFAEQYDGQVHLVETSQESYLVNGKIEQYCRDNNIPSWKSASGEKFWTATKIDIFGQDNGSLIKTDKDSEQWIYVSNFTDGSVTKPWRAKIIHGDGTVVWINQSFSSTNTLTFQAMSICRVPCSIRSINASDIDNVIFYTIEIQVDSSTVISRKFEMRARGYSSHTFYMLNEVNMYDTLVVDNIARAEEVEGDKIRIRQADQYLYTDAGTKFTARTGLKTKDDLALLRSAISKQDNLMADGEYAWKISIEPGSFVVYDEAEDLVGLEFNFTIVEKINRRARSVGSIEANTKIDVTDIKFVPYVQ